MLNHFLRMILFLALPVCLFTSVMMVRAAPIKEGRELKYVLEPVFDKDSLRFRVDLSFKGDASGTTKLVLPNEWGGQSNLYQAVRHLQVISPDATLSDTAEQYVKTLAYRPPVGLLLVIMRGSLLHRYWFKTKHHLGFGVAAYSIEDAKSLVDDAARRVGWSCGIVEIVEDIDVRELDQNHVVPNMGPPNFRGVWFPNLNLS